MYSGASVSCSPCFLRFITSLWHSVEPLKLLYHFEGHINSKFRNPLLPLLQISSLWFVRTLGKVTLQTIKQPFCLYSGQSFPCFVGFTNDYYVYVRLLQPLHQEILCGLALRLIEVNALLYEGHKGLPIIHPLCISSVLLQIT